MRQTEGTGNVFCFPGPHLEMVQSSLIGFNSQQNVWELFWVWVRACSCGTRRGASPCPPAPGTASPRRPQQELPAAWAERIRLLTTSITGAFPPGRSPLPVHPNQAPSREGSPGPGPPDPNPWLPGQQRSRICKLMTRTSCVGALLSGSRHLQQTLSLADLLVLVRKTKPCGAGVQSPGKELPTWRQTGIS